MLKSNLAKVDSTSGINFGDSFQGCCKIFYASTSAPTATSIRALHRLCVRSKAAPEYSPLQIGPETLISPTVQPQAL